MKNSALLIDGENFQFKLEEILKEEKVKKSKKEVAHIQLRKLIQSITEGYNLNISKIIYYSAKLHLYEDSVEKSKELILAQRTLKRSLENQGIDFVIAGHVRRSEAVYKGKKKFFFREKGVDVRIAVDMISMAQMKDFSTILLLSSDSDLQPAVSKVKELKKEIIYVGFKHAPNKGLVMTTDRKILISNQQVVESL